MRLEPAVERLNGHRLRRRSLIGSPPVADPEKVREPACESASVLHLAEDCSWPRKTSSAFDEAAL